MLRSAWLYGVEAYEVHVEVDVSPGLPGHDGGLPDASVRESRNRVRSAIRNAGFSFPAQWITVNLAPADRRKAGVAFDLPIAVGILAANGQIERRHVTTGWWSASSHSTAPRSPHEASCRLRSLPGATDWLVS